MKKLKPIKCPKCRSPRHVGTLDIIPGIAYVSGVTPGGNFQYVGETMVLWDGQETQYDAKGRVLMVCDKCSHRWWKKLPKGKKV